MREIEFRGKNKETGKWEYGYISGIHTCHIDEKGNTTEIFSYYINAGHRTVWAKTVGQYTGLCDKNGKKIYEGDIVKSRTSDTPYVIKYRDCGFCCIDEYGITINMKQYAFDRFECEVIGNIHDNPELLQEQ